MKNVLNSKDAGRPEPMARRLVTARIWSLLIPVRLSADAAYRSGFGIGELDRRLLLTIGEAGASRPHALMAAAGQDKAQVSRALKRLAAAGLIVRPSLRGPIQLSGDGERVTAAMMHQAQQRNDALVAGIAREDVGFVLSVVEQLTERAIALFAEEKAFGSGGHEAAAVRPAGYDAAARGMIVPPLFTLLIYLQRSASIAYKRLVGLSSFDWQVLSQVVEHAPLPLARLVLMLGRDKSQAGRTVKRLEAAALVERLREPGRRAVLLTPTARGRDVYAVMEEEALRRNAVLIEGFAADTLARFLAIIDRLTENALRL